jgi:circadian clock protein KaiC
VTGLLIKESDKAVAATLDFWADALSVLAEYVLLLQHVPFRGQMHRILSVLKLRFSAHDTALREFLIEAPAGIRVLASTESASGVIAGITADQERVVTGRPGTGQESVRPDGGG